MEAGRSQQTGAPSADSSLELWDSLVEQKTRGKSSSPCRTWRYSSSFLLRGFFSELLPEL